LVRRIVADQKLKYTERVSEFSRTLGEELLEPTRLYTGVLNRVLEDPRFDNQISVLSHITGGGIAANLSRVLPDRVGLDVDRSTWSPNPVFRVLADWGGYSLNDLESTWNLGLGFAAVVRSSIASDLIEFMNAQGIPCWQLGVIESTPCDSELPGYVTEAKGVRGGAVRMVSSYAV
jgi:phosphoribosylformylglycinamidine cyclo-ligase